MSQGSAIFAVNYVIMYNSAMLANKNKIGIHQLLHLSKNMLIREVQPLSLIRVESLRKENEKSNS